MPAFWRVWLPLLLATVLLLPHSTFAAASQLGGLDPDAFLQAASKLVARSGAADGPPDTLCLQSYSRRYITRWASTTQQLCQVKGHLKIRATAGAAGAACSIHPEVDLTTCWFSQLHINSSGFLGSSIRPDALPTPAPGSLQLACQPQPAASVLRGRLLHEGMSLFFNSTLQPAAAVTPTCAPPPGPAALPLLMLRRDPTNPYHVLEQLVSAFAALAVAQAAGHVTSFSNIQAVVLDDHSQGPYWPILDRMSGPLGARQLRAQPYPPGTCLAAAVLAPWVGHLQSLLTQNHGSAGPITCPSEVLLAVSMWLRWLFRELLPHQQEQNGQHDRAGRLQQVGGSATAAAGALLRGAQAPRGTQRHLASHDQQQPQPQVRAQEPALQQPSRHPVSAAAATQHAEGAWLGRRSLAAILATHAEQLQRENEAQQQQQPRRQRQRQRRKHRRRRKQQGPREVRLAAAQEPSHAVEGRRLLVLWLSRAKQEAAAQGKLSAWQAARVLGNEQQVVAGLQKVVGAWNQLPLCPRGKRPERGRCRPRVVYELKVAELSQMKLYPDQLQLLFQTGVLVGVHGAALTNQVWLPPEKSGVVELWHGMTENYHYHNMAYMLLHAYASVQTPQTPDGGYERDANVTAVAQAAAWAMQEVAWRRSRQRRRFWQGWGGDREP